MSYLFKTKSVIFLSKHITVSIDSPVNVILSPEFYWLTKRVLPVKTTWQAKRLCDAVFDEILPKEGSYSYHVIKESEGNYLLIAYDAKNIIEQIKKMGVDISLIGNFYLAQTEMPEGSFGLDEYALIRHEEVVTLLPRKLAGDVDAELSNIQEFKLSKHKIPIERYSFPLDKKLTKALLIVLMLYISLNLIETFSQKRALDVLVQKQEDLYTKYDLPATSWQVEAIKKRVSDTHKEQKKLRDDTYKTLSTLELQTGEYFMQMSLESKKASFRLQTKSDKRAVALRAILEKKFNTITIKQDGVVLIVEVIYG